MCFFLGGVRGGGVYYYNPSKGLQVQGIGFRALGFWALGVWGLGLHAFGV